MEFASVPILEAREIGDAMLRQNAGIFASFCHRGIISQIRLPSPEIKKTTGRKKLTPSLVFAN